MSVQNMLKKPSFSKNVMGYSVSEVDKYVDNATERYNSVCAENLELKRRVIRLQLMLDEASAKLAESEKKNCAEKPLDRSALSAVFDVLDAEKKRTEAFYEDLKATLNKISEEKAEVGDDYEWEEVLNSFIESVSEAETEEDTAVEETDTDAQSDQDAEAQSVVVEHCGEGGTDSMLENFESFIMADDEDEMADDEDEADEKDADESKAELEVNSDEFELTSENILFSEGNEAVNAENDDEFSAEETLSVDVEPSEEDAIMNSDTDNDEDASYEEETEMLLKLLQGTFNVGADESKPFDHNLGAEYESEGDGVSEEALDAIFEKAFQEAMEETFDEAFFEDDYEETEEAASDEKKEKTPAEIAAELDFYTDSVYRDGESFDPMTLAHNVTSNRKPKYDNYFNSDFGKTKKK